MTFEEWWFTDALNDGLHKIVPQYTANKIWEAAQTKGSRETAYNKPQPEMAEQMNLLESATSGDRSGDK